MLFPLRQHDGLGTEQLHCTPGSSLQVEVEADRGVAGYGPACKSAANRVSSSSPSMREGRVPSGPWYEQRGARPVVD